jgi:hypothetical protein
VIERLEGYQATQELERELERTGTAALEGGRYRATVARAGSRHYEAWTDSLPFVYGRPSSTLEGALDNLERQVREAKAGRQES